MRQMTPALTLIVVTHNLGQARRVSDTTMFLYDGHLVEHGETEQIFEHPIPRSISSAMDRTPQLLERGILRAGADRTLRSAPNRMTQCIVGSSEISRARLREALRSSSLAETATSPSSTNRAISSRCFARKAARATSSLLEKEVERPLAHRTGHDEIVEEHALEAGLGKCPGCGVDDERTCSLGSFLSAATGSARHPQYQTYRPVGLQPRRKPPANCSSSGYSTEPLLAVRG